MDIKLKNRLLAVLTFAGLSFGIKGSLNFFFNSGAYFDDYRSYYSNVFILIYGIIAILFLLFSLYLIFSKQIIHELITINLQERYNSLPIDVLGLILAFTGIIALVDTLLVNNEFFNVFSTIKDLLLNTLFMGLTLLQIILLRRRFKSGRTFEEDWKKTLVYQGFYGVSDTLHLSSTGIAILFLLVIVFFSGFGIPIISEEPGLHFPYFLLFVAITLPALVITAKRISQFNRLAKNVNLMAKGQLSSDLPVEGWSPLKTLAADINTLKQGISVAEKAMSKSERLKTELITNVSHDLRTPLTSIITYTELLKKPDLTIDEQKSYIEIIDRKSKRLNVLIEDLFEASKMASGDIELDRKKVDLVQLLQQTLAENDERIEASPLQFRFTKPEDPVYAFVDGQKLWRVFDNLLGNCIKYSLEGTRVFISIKDCEEKTIITFKNISKYELSEDIDELFERFKRGDESRHTEGSGLGLAIAKSIIDLHEGDLEIEVDGDLFKVTVKLDK
ncbi:HAMP domain-containing sensor histidine kinase [Pullulanibacillus sp. KACC 23026]|uniref:sensor histidine kinase n=1 Tax=Pullulanibacillus sp. KACC 23026 TaxID=3028315 RepID=UPI0023B0C772|nr:HAMP domain-containing sensor histidine kinase [Pullulanibacillus sp. KACC 23026]WEG12414.1 HAMP domain-containing sensor histidine kinase [Pullulanibacillus sp. KACC 23026]